MTVDLRPVWFFVTWVELAGKYGDAIPIGSTVS